MSYPLPWEEMIRFVVTGSRSPGGGNPAAASATATTNPLLLLKLLKKRPENRPDDSSEVSDAEMDAFSAILRGFEKNLREKTSPLANSGSPER